MFDRYIQNTVITVFMYPCLSITSNNSQKKNSLSCQTSDATKKINTGIARSFSFMLYGSNILTLTVITVFSKNIGLYKVYEFRTMALGITEKQLYQLVFAVVVVF